MLFRFLRSLININKTNHEVNSDFREISVQCFHKNASEIRNNSLAEFLNVNLISYYFLKLSTKSLNEFVFYFKSLKLDVQLVISFQERLFNSFIINYKNIHYVDFYSRCKFNLK